MTNRHVLLNIWSVTIINYSESNRMAKQELIEMGEDTDGMVESTSKLRDQIKALTGFDIMEDENTYKNIMDIVIGIGDTWEDLTDLEQAGLLESLAGKQQSNALAAALQNADMIKEVYETAQNADGSAQEELESQIQSIEGYIARLTNAVQEFWYTAIDSEQVKIILDFVTTLIKGLTELVDILGTIPTVAGVITGALGIKNILSGKNSGGRAKKVQLEIAIFYDIKEVNYSPKV